MDDFEQPNSITDAQERARLDNPVLQPDETFGNYRVVKCLCAGLLAHYYHMQHIRDLHDVTVGIFHPRANGKDKFIKRLTALKKVVAGLKHEAIPKIKDCSVIEERVCLFLDAVKGHTLSQYFEAHGHPGQKGVGVTATTRIIAQLLGALGYAHAQGIDHRDLDSDLIYVQEDGSIRILGMGVKAAMGVDVFESIVSASISPLETRKTLKHLNSFDVMSPEYRAGVAEDSRVDIYAIGVIGYWLLTARKPEAAKYKEPTEFVEGLMPNWNTFFEKSLVRDKENRFQSCKMALIGLKKTELEPTSESSGHIQRQIDRIPVPKGILERGELASRTYRLILIGLLGVLLTGIGASFLNRVYSVKSGSSASVAEAVESAGDANLQIRLKPAGARVSFEGEVAGYTAQGGALDLKVAPGEYRVRVSAPGYIERVVSTTIPEKSDAPQRLDLELSPALADIEFKTEPGAAVRLIDAEGGERLLGESDESGVLALSQSLAPGEYNFRIEKSGFITEALVDQTLEAGSVTQISVPLTEARVEALFLSDPEDALIRLDGDEVGRTPLRLNTLLPGQEYVVEVQKEGYRPVTRQIGVDSGEDLTIDLGRLVRQSGSVRLQLIRVDGTAVTESLLDELEIVLNAKQKPYSPDALSSLAVGPTALQLQHPLYRSETVRLEIEDGENYVVPLTLVPRPGEVSLKVPQGIDYSLLIDGQPVARDELPTEVAAGRVIQLQLRMTNYLTMRRQILLKPTENFLWEVDPVPIPGPSIGRSWEVPYIDIDFGWIPAGQFTMGSPLTEHARIPNEGPKTEVRFKQGFWVGVYEITQEQYRAIEQSTPSFFEGRNRPVESISWLEARDFCRSLTEIEREAGRLPEGYVYRLPTEAEWEYAARAGTATPFFWGDRADASLGQFNGVYPIDRSDGLRTPEGGYGTADVGQYAPNNFGLYDVHGNVREWTLDQFSSRLPGGSIVDPNPDRDGNRIAVRGGGWEDTAARARSAARDQSSADRSSNALGFRVVLGPEFL